MRPSSHWRRGLTIAALVLGIAAIQPTGATAAEADEDGDGVADLADQCFDTPAGDLVNADGCSACPCEGPPSRAAYLQCVTDAVRARKQSGAMTRRMARAALKAARKSSCGDVSLTRCCVYPTDDDGDTIVGKCKVVPVDTCDQMSEQLEWAEDADPGSCLPNPCVF